MKYLQNYSLFEKPIEVEFARAPSDATLVEKGVFDTTIAVRRRDLKIKSKK